MPGLTSYPNGFPGGVAIHGMPVLNTYSGNVYWVNSASGGDGNKGTRARPFATLDYAIGRCTANNGDIIMVMANHAETITGVAGIALDVAGVTVIGSPAISSLFTMLIVRPAESQAVAVARIASVPSVFRSVAFAASRYQPDEISVTAPAAAANAPPFLLSVTVIVLPVAPVTWSDDKNTSNGIG